MPGLVLGIYGFPFDQTSKDVDGLDKPGHDVRRVFRKTRGRGQAIASRVPDPHHGL
jgi:hypothetical protein